MSSHPMIFAIMGTSISIIAAHAPTSSYPVVQQNGSINTNPIEKGCCQKMLLYAKAKQTYWQSPSRIGCFIKKWFLAISTKVHGDLVTIYGFEGLGATACPSRLLAVICIIAQCFYNVGVPTVITYFVVFYDDDHSPSRVKIRIGNGYIFKLHKHLLTIHSSRPWIARSYWISAVGGLV